VSGTSYSTYDQRSGTFIDANGNAAVFGAGAQNLKPQENWYDLMKDPRQT
jgi:phospholipid/cholesterol/gamma-HCH transport system substrate-binding protein